MKVNIEIDLSPQEARELMGFPDLGKFHETLLKSMEEQLKTGGNEALTTMLQPFITESQRAFSSYQKMLEGFANLKSSTASKK